MRKKSLLALLLALSMLLSGCALVTVDQAADNARIIVDVNGETITKQQVSNAVNNTISQNEYMNQLYAMFGMTANYPTDEATITPQVIDYYVEQLVSLQKAKELGLDQFTDEEKAHIQEHADEDWQSYLSQIASNYFPGLELEGEALEAEAQKYIAEYGLSGKDAFEQSAADEVLLEKLNDETVKDVTVTEEELEAQLAEKVAADQETYTADPDAYGNAVNSGTAVYYAPAGYRTVKHILINLLEADSSAIDELDDALTAAENALENADEDADTDALQAAVDEAQAAVDAATETAFANIQEKVNEVYEKATAEGADFDALITEYSDDSMPATGYAIREGYVYFVEPFVTAAMALENIGDVSEPVRSTYGYHIIQYVGDVAEGAVALDTVRDALETELLADKKEATYNDAVAAWTAAADVKTYPEKMN
ncbi:MAG: peptidylprolyl isomerase [Clostridia bacterium]|nr:peptidylprolyl isomerase [Clostridia bacterium]